MHIAMVGWLRGRPVPPIGYGGIERMTAILATELIRQGHQITLLAPEGSCVEGAQHIFTNDFDDAYWKLRDLHPDVVHSHEPWAIESVIRRQLDVPYLATSHVNHAVGHTRNVVYLSKSQRTQHGVQENKDLSASPVVYVPINPRLKPCGYPKEDYLLFLGMVAEHKGVYEAAQVAKLLGRTLKVCGPAWGEYADKVAAMPNVEMCGEVSDPLRSEIIEKSYAMMCLHNNHGGWMEPGLGVFGESIAFNVPVAGFRNGCIPELVRDGHNGWLADHVDDMATFMEYADYPKDMAADRITYSVEHIARQYLSLYGRVANGETWG